MDGFGEMFISLFAFVIVFGSILLLAYVTSRFIANKSGTALKGKNISIIETISLGLDSKLHLVKVGDEFMLISVSGKNIQLLTKVNMEGYSEEELSPAGNGFDFKEIFEKYIQNFKGRQNVKGNVKPEQDKKGSDSNFRQNLVKLRSITSGIGKYDSTSGDEKTNENQS